MVFSVYHHSTVITSVEILQESAPILIYLLYKLLKQIFFFFLTRYMNKNEQMFNSNPVARQNSVPPSN